MLLWEKAQLSVNYSNMHIIWTSIYMYVEYFKTLAAQTDKCLTWSIIRNEFSKDEALLSKTNNGIQPCICSRGRG